MNENEFSQEDDQIEVVKLTGNDWVISSTRQERATGCGVIGFVTQVAGLYELLQLSEPARPQYFDRLHAAVVACSATADTLAPAA